MDKGTPAGKPIFPIYLIGLVWVVCAFFVPLFEPFHYLLVALLSAAASLLCGLFLRKKERSAVAYDPALDFDGDAQLILEEADANLVRMLAACEHIEDEYISEKAGMIERVSRQNFMLIRENPELLSRDRRFLSYYLSVAARLFERYRALAHDHVKNSATMLALSRTEGLLDDVGKAFERQESVLTSGQAFDFTADIAVLDSRLASVGVDKG